MLAAAQRHPPAKGSLSDLDGPLFGSVIARCGSKAIHHAARRRSTTAESVGGSPPPLPFHAARRSALLLRIFEKPAPDLNLHTSLAPAQDAKGLGGTAREQGFSRVSEAPANERGIFWELLDSLKNERNFGPSFWCKSLRFSEKGAWFPAKDAANSVFPFTCNTWIVVTSTVSTLS